MPRVDLKKKEYKILDFKGWVAKQMKLTGKRQYEVAEALGISPGRLSLMLKIPDVKDRSRKKGNRCRTIEIDPDAEEYCHIRKTVRYFD